MVLYPSEHLPVLLHEVVEWLQPGPGAILVDGTMGGGGHARLLAEKVQGGGRIIGIDCDPSAVELAAERLARLPVEPIAANYCDLPEVLAACDIPAVDGILLDLGLSSDQLADASRGFSFDSDGPLDLRFDPTRGEPAWRLIQRLSTKHLANILFAWGEERYSRRIAHAIIQQRQLSPIHSARELAEVVRSVLPKERKERIDPATRTFQALRIEVNDELKSLETALRRLPDCLKPGGRLAIISFHSLEDRRVKQAFVADERLHVLTRKPVRATSEELDRNQRARSAKLRVAERI
ncbi:MAG: 16S rRNA (cytosine(1402)-N(4))-methyltransferase RsmH [Pirellulales bacterium]|nr:16S rRNA (cytosine(1402)-N(4))-methyltransferase RsmH [Pirellulales bacterium]